MYKKQHILNSILKMEYPHSFEINCVFNDLVSNTDKLETKSNY